MSGFFFLTGNILYNERNNTERPGINTERLGVKEDLDYADEIALLSATMPICKPKQIIYK